MVPNTDERANVVATLRKLADEVERGEWPECLIKPSEQKVQVYLDKRAPREQRMDG